MARKTLTDKGVAAIKPRPQRYAFPDPELTGHYVRIQPSGAKAFIAVARSPAGKQIWTHIGAADVMGIDEARGRAREAIKRVRAGRPAIEAKPDTFGDVAANWRKRHVEAKGLRTAREINRLLGSHVLPRWHNRVFTDIRRSEVAALLDHVEDNHGAYAADAVLTIVRNIMGWHAARSDDYNPPIVKGMRRISTKEHARERTLSDEELRAVWKRAEGQGTFGAFVRMAILTAQRRGALASMRWDDLDGNIWTIQSVDRAKGTGASLVLPTMATQIIEALPRAGSNPFVFAGRANGAINGFSKLKRRLDAGLSGVETWTIHDLRRTSRSLMSRAGVDARISERIMGHTIRGVEGIYDRHAYRDEKADALAKLASLIEMILRPPKGNVRPIREAAL